MRAHEASAPGDTPPEADARVLRLARLAPAARDAPRVALFGGSFDPPHAGHLFVLERVLRAFALDHVVFVPAARPPHKPERELASDRDRVALLELLLEGRAGVSIWSDELLRPGPSYTLETVRRLCAERAAGPPPAPSGGTGREREQPFFVIGSDNLPGLAGWHGVEELLRLARPIVVLRRGTPLAPDVLAGLSPAARARVEAGFLELEPFDASSSALRQRLAAGEDPGATLPPRLWEYVRARGIYHAS